MAHFAGWRGAGRQPDAHLATYPNLGHAFLPGEGGPSPDDYRLLNYIPAAVIDDIGNWVRHHYRRASA